MSFKQPSEIEGKTPSLVVTDYTSVLSQRQINVHKHVLMLKSRGTDPQSMAHSLVDTANLAGGDGNISAIVIRVQ